MRHISILCDHIFISLCHFFTFQHVLKQLDRPFHWNCWVFIYFWLSMKRDSCTSDNKEKSVWKYIELWLRWYFFLSLPCLCFVRFLMNKPYFTVSKYYIEHDTISILSTTSWNLTQARKIHTHKYGICVQVCNDSMGYGHAQG